MRTRCSGPNQQEGRRPTPIGSVELKSYSGVARGRERGVEGGQACKGGKLAPGGRGILQGDNRGTRTKGNQTFQQG